MKPATEKGFRIFPQTVLLPLTFCSAVFWHGGTGLEILFETTILKTANRREGLKLNSMKKIFTLLSSSLFSLSLLAFDGSRLSISTVSTSTQLKVEVDGRKFAIKNNSITLGYLDAGMHEVKIYRVKNQNSYGFEQRQVIYNSTVMLRKGFHTDITVNRFGKAITDEQRIQSDDVWGNDENDYYDSQDGGWSGGYTDIMSNREFSDLKTQLNKEWFENNRLNSVKVVLSKNHVTTVQVKELMLMFTFESNRLEIAKYAYCNTVDQQNYYRLNDALTFSSSRDELARFLRETHK